MQEIGGYIELDTYHLPMLHEGAAALNCGRNALAYLIRARRIKKLWIPKLICGSVTRVCEREGASYSLYSIGPDLLPAQEFDLGENEWLYFVNYYSQFDNERISQYVRRYERVIVDQAQSYFQAPIPGVDTVYTCRKYFGVADGAFLYTDAILDEVLPRDESFERMRFLLGRFERTASEFYGEYAANNKMFATEPIKRMSRLTWNLLHGIDYNQVKEKRTENFSYLHSKFKSVNRLDLMIPDGAFMYPLYLPDGKKIRKALQKEKLYIPTLWPDVFEVTAPDDLEYKMAENILPLPVDQRYGIEEMKYIIQKAEVFCKSAL